MGQPISWGVCWAALLLAAGIAVPAPAQGSATDHGPAEARQPRKAAHKASRATRPPPAARRARRPHARTLAEAPVRHAGVVAVAAPGGAPSAGAHSDDNEPHTEHIFGFIEGASLHKPGETDLKFDNIGGFGRRGGAYHAVGSKLEVHTGVVDGVNAAIGVLGDYHRVRSVPGLEDVPARARFSGASAELRLGLLRREETGVGVTLRVEPSVSRFDDLSGRRASSYGAENALLVDTELLPGALFAAMNLFYDFERTRERGAVVTERGSSAGIGGALAYQVAPGFFAGGEARYLRAYDGLGLDRFQGDAVLVGPTLYATLASHLSLTAAFSVRVSGGDVARPGENGPGGEAEARTSGNVVGFERYQARLKLVYGF